MTEVNLNEQLIQLLIAHGFLVTQSNELIYCPDLSQSQLKAVAYYFTEGDHVSSRLNISVFTGSSFHILESFGDIGANPEDAFIKNFNNFTSCSFHVIVAALGATNDEITKYVEIENWDINGESWKVYIGGLAGKSNGQTATDINPASDFFTSIEGGIRLQSLTNDIHWFRSYYFQHDNKIAGVEFLMDNEPLALAEELFRTIPILPDVDFCSYRNFIILKRI